MAVNDHHSCTVHQRAVCTNVSVDGASLSDARHAQHPDCAMSRIGGSSMGVDVGAAVPLTACQEPSPLLPKDCERLSS